jgi:hypothetical protein
MSDSLSNTTRESQRAIAVKIESASGTDVIGGTPSASDYIAADFSFSIDPSTVQNDEELGGLDMAVPIVTGLRGAVQITVKLRGSGLAGTSATPGTAPEWGQLLRCASWEEVVTAAAVGTPTAATAGTTTTATLATPFVTTAQAYRGMPCLLTGNPAAGATGLITDYTAGRVATFGQTFAATLSAGTNAQVPINVLYRPTSDESVVQTCTVYLYEDGLRHRLTGSGGTWALRLVAGQPAEAVFSFRGTVLDAHQAVTLTSAANRNVAGRRQPPIWANGQSQLNRLLARTDQANFDAGVQFVDVENPEAVQGYDPALITGRMSRLSLAPYAMTTRSPGRLANLQAGDSIPFTALWGATAGNRFGFTLASGKIIQMSRTKRNNLGVDSIVIQPDQADVGGFLTCF